MRVNKFDVTNLNTYNAITDRKLLWNSLSLLLKITGMLSYSLYSRTIANLVRVSKVVIFNRLCYSAIEQ